jgi:hypothetical protein
MCLLAINWGGTISTRLAVFGHWRSSPGVITGVVYSDSREAFAKMLPAERSIVGNAHIITIEQDISKTVNTLQNSNLPPLVLH